jgi:hypothetical protein
MVSTTGARFGFNMISEVSPRGALRFMIVDGKVNADSPPAQQSRQKLHRAIPEGETVTSATLAASFHLSGKSICHVALAA